MKDYVGEYEVLSLIGEGGNGRVYAVKHPRTGVTHALKEFEDPKEGKEEAAILLSLHQEGIPECLDVFEEDGKTYLLMEFMEGKKLSEITEEKEEILYRLAKLVSYLHSLPIPLIHGDLKPENIIVTNENKVCILDFGSAFYLNCPRKKIKASDGYAAKELAQGKAGLESDVYAFGKLMVYLLTGRDPLLISADVGKEVLLRYGMSRFYAGLAANCLRAECSKRLHSGKEVLEKLSGRRKKAVSFSKPATDLGAVLSFTGLWLYFCRGVYRGKFVLLFGCLLLLAELVIQSIRRSFSEGEYTLEYTLFLSDSAQSGAASRSQ